MFQTNHGHFSHMISFVVSDPIKIGSEISCLQAVNIFFAVLDESLNSFV